MPRLPFEVGRTDDENRVRLPIVEVQRDHTAGQLDVVRTVGGPVLAVDGHSVGVDHRNQRGIGLEDAHRDVVVSGDVRDSAGQRFSG